METGDYSGSLYFKPNHSLDEQPSPLDFTGMAKGLKIYCCLEPPSILPKSVTSVTTQNLSEKASDSNNSSNMMALMKL